jgi:hypothetical protein
VGDKSGDRHGYQDRSAHRAEFHPRFHAAAFPITSPPGRADAASWAA